MRAGVFVSGVVREMRDCFPFTSCGFCGDAAVEEILIVLCGDEGLLCSDEIAVADLFVFVAEFELELLLDEPELEPELLDVADGTNTLPTSVFWSSGAGSPPMSHPEFPKDIVD